MEKSQLKKLNKMAQEFNYIGGNEDLDNNYIGMPGEYDFGGENGQSFASEYAAGREFTIVFENNTAVDRTIAICPAYYDTVARLAAEGHSDVTAILTDGIIATDGSGDLTATSGNPGKTIFGLMQWIKQNPTRIVGFYMQCDTRSQFETKMTYQNLAPFAPLGTQIISLSKFRPANQLGTDKIEADLIKNGTVLDMNDQNLVKLVVKQGVTLTVNFYFGAVDNRAAKLRARATIAHDNIRRRHLNGK